MRTIINTLIIASVALLATSCMALQGGAYSQEYYADDYAYFDNQYYGDAAVSMQVFYNELRPHGRWIRHNTYGNVWIPRVNKSFHPYATNGYWVMTDYGNTWVSNYSWGWAPFHYGRWFFDDYYGWAWVPGFEWAPAWVSWRTGGGYYGWAPLGPRMGISVNIHIPVNYWTFLPNRYMYNRSMHKYYSGRGTYATIYNQTTIINNVNVYNNTNYYSGPSSRDYQSVTGRTTTVRTLDRNNTSGRTTVSDRSVSVYAPQALRDGNSSSRVQTSTSNSTRTSTRESNATIGREGTTTAPSSRTSTQPRRTTTTTTTRSSTTSPASTRQTQTTRATSRGAATRSQGTTTRTQESTTRSQGATTRTQSTTRGTSNTQSVNSRNTSTTRTNTSSVRTQSSSTPTRSSATSTTNSRSGSSNTRSTTSSGRTTSRTR